MHTIIKETHVEREYPVVEILDKKVFESASAAKKYLRSDVDAYVKKFDAEKEKHIVVDWVANGVCYISANLDKSGVKPVVRYKIVEVHV